MNEYFDTPLLGVDIKIELDPKSVGLMVFGLFFALVISMIIAGFILKKI